ncbi:hypothetical protein ACOME3_003454 [Neoechinorhynchus agilis]
MILSFFMVYAYLMNVDGNRYEILRFGTNLPQNTVLPLSVKSTCTTFASASTGIAQYCTLRVEITATDIKGISNVSVRIEIPDRYSHLFKYKGTATMTGSGSVQRSTSSTRSKTDFLNRILIRSGSISGNMDRRQQQRDLSSANLPPYYFQKSVGRPKYDPHTKSIIWNIGSLPKRGEGPFKPHRLIVGLREPNIRFGDDLGLITVFSSVKRSCVGTECQVRSISFRSQSSCRPHSALKTFVRYFVETKRETITGDEIITQKDDDALSLMGDYNRRPQNVVTRDSSSSSTEPDDSDHELNLLGDSE